MSPLRKKQAISVILMTYGSPKSLNGIPQYLSNIYGGRKASKEVLAEFRRRYKLIGGSPLVRITNEQAAALETELNNQHPDGPTFYVRAGMRFSQPYITAITKKLSRRAKHVIGIILSPQYSPIIMQGYRQTLENAVRSLNRTDITLSIAKDWHLEPLFLQSLAQRVAEALERFPKEERMHVPVLFSAHSMPKRVIEKEPNYITSLKETAAAVAKLLDFQPKQWMFCYQSAGHTPEEWLKPDFSDIIPKLREQGYKHVLIAPVQFLADHLEILYDVGIAARQQAEEHGIAFARTESLNTSPIFIKSLAEVVKKNMLKKRPISLS